MDAARPAKEAAARAALRIYISNTDSNHMRIGLGSGSTAECFVRLLGEKVRRQELAVSSCVASSHKTEVLARSLSLPLVALEEAAPLDLFIDGADEIDPSLRMIKGGGGCLLREKILAHTAKTMIALVDSSKRVPRLGAFPLPVEITPFAWQATARQVKTLLENRLGHSVSTTLRSNAEQPLTTDNGNYTIDCHCRALSRPQTLEASLNAIPGVVENGLFTQTAQVCIVGKNDSSVQIFVRKKRCGKNKFAEKPRSLQQKDRQQPEQNSNANARHQRKPHKACPSP